MKDGMPVKKVLLGITTVFCLIGCGNHETEKPSVPADIHKEVIPAPEKSVSTVYREDKKMSTSNLIWSDHFDTLDESKWNVVTEPGWKPSGRKQYYLPRNVTVKDSVLTIHVKREKYEQDPYTSGALHTLNKQTFHYGRLEIRAKIPDGKGLLPALWLQPVDRSEFPEIDMMEVIGQEPNRLWNVVHWKDKQKVQKRDFTHTDTENPLNEDFHVYGINWTKKKLTFTLDGKVTFTMTENIPQKPMYLMMNVAVGGEWATDPSPEQQFPKEMQIDYVKYYIK